MYEIRWLIQLLIRLQCSLITLALLILNDRLVNQPIFCDSVVWSWWSPRVIGHAFMHLIRQTKLHSHAPQVISYSHYYFCSLTGKYVFIYIQQKLDGFSIFFFPFILSEDWPGRRGLGQVWCEASVGTLVSTLLPLGGLCETFSSHIYF